MRHGLCRRYGDDECIPGCFPPAKQCSPGGKAYECSYPPDQLAAALAAQEASSSFAGRNNEMVLDTRSVVHGLPNTVEGFFFLSTMADGEASMRSVQQRFAAAYHLTAESAPPLVRLSFGGKGGFIDGDAPFTLVP